MMASCVLPPEVGESGDELGEFNAMLSHLEDETTLVAEAQSGDANAFGALISQYESHVYRLALKITRNPQDAEDALQDAFLKAYAHLGEFRGDSRFSTWLVRIATNAALTKMRQRSSEWCVSSTQPNQTEKRVSRPREMKDSYDDPEERYSKTELLGILSEVIESLNLSLRMVFVLRDFQSFSTQETARFLGISEVAVRNRLLRARLQVRQRLHGWVRVSPDPEAR
jgi:RNA polymerase sigma-70 factor (ECF subfamily)